MKFLMTIFLGLALLSATDANAQKVETLKFEVGGVCDMCKDRIEKALDVKGVKSAVYTLENHQVEIVYNKKKLSENQLHQIIADAGHDTCKITASDEAYSKIHECCKYREHEDH